MFPNIECAVEDGIGRIALNRPHVHNAVTREMWDAIPEAMAAAQKKGARVIVFEGRGTSFASGADLAELRDLPDLESAKRHWFSIYDSLNCIASFELPTIALVHGPCIGGGCLLSIACDLRYCEPSSRFGVPISQLGIILDDDNLSRIIQLIGPAFAKELIFTASTIAADRAFALGLVNAIITKELLQATVLNIAMRIRDNSPQTIVHAKRTIARLSGADKWGTDRQQHSVVQSYMSEEFKKRSAT